MKLKLKGVILSLLLFSSVAGLSLLCYTTFHVEQKTAGFTVELGDSVPNDLQEYLRAGTYMQKKATLDLSHVDAKTVGCYEATVSVGKHCFTYSITITDTTGPTLTTIANNSYFATGRSYPIEAFLLSAEDASHTVHVTSDGKSTLCFGIAGSYEVPITATDPSGNTTTKTISIQVNDAPVLMGALNKAAKLGEAIDFTENVIAIDDELGNLTDAIVIDTSNIDFEKPGSYPIYYSVSDNYSLEEKAEGTFYLYENKKKNTDTDQTDFSFTQDELNLLCNSNYFEYELLPADNTNSQKVIDLVKPISINLTAKDSSATGNAFLYKIDADYVYGVSVLHVLKLIHENAYITFFNDCTIRESLEYVHNDDASELAVFRFPTESIPPTTLVLLKEAAIDTTCYPSLEEGEALLTYSENYDFYPNFTCLIKETTLVDAAKIGFVYEAPTIATTRSVIVGMSGGPLLDYQGHVLGATSHYIPSEELDYFMRLDSIHKLEQELRQ